MTGAGTSPARTLHDLVREHAATLARAGVPSPEHDARALTRAALGVDAAGVRTAGLPDAEGRARLAELVHRRAERVPLQHLVGATWFRYLRLRCRPGVFVPRPETEVVAGLAIDAARRVRTPVVAEPCTGTGAIALSVLAEVPGADVWATDLDPAAVALAGENLATVLAGDAEVSGPAAGARCRILEGDLLAPLEPHLRGGLDVLVSNPPYLPDTDQGRLPPEVARHDPGLALYGGSDGLEVVDRLLDAAVRWLKPGGTLVLEIDDRRADEAARGAQGRGLVEVRVEHDLTGAPRALVARRRVEEADG